MIGTRTIARLRAVKTYGRVFVAVLVVLGAALGAGCSGDSDDDAGGNPSSDNTSSATTAGSKQPEPTGRPLPKDQTLNLEQRHANGVVVRLTGIRFTPTSTTVSIEAFNGFTDEVALNEREMALVDDLDHPYPFRPPADNARLVVKPGETLRGDLAFLGRPDENTTALRLVINSLNPPREEPGRLGSYYPFDRNPPFVIAGIPVDD